MKNIDVKNKANISCSDILEETCLKLDCCGIEVGSWYEYCPKCGKKIDIEKCKKRTVEPCTGLYELFDYATWVCPCGNGYERYEYSYCPICGKKRAESDWCVVEFIQQRR